MLRVCGQRSFGSQSVIVGHAILRTNMLQDLLVNVKFGTRVGQAVVVVGKAMAEVGLGVSHAAVAAVRRAIQTLRVVTKILGAFTLALVSIGVWAVHRGVRHEGRWSVLLEVGKMVSHRKMRGSQQSRQGWLL